MKLYLLLLFGIIIVSGCNIFETTPPVHVWCDDVKVQFKTICLNNAGEPIIEETHIASLSLYNTAQVQEEITQQVEKRNNNTPNIDTQFFMFHKTFTIPYHFHTPLFFC